MSKQPKNNTSRLLARWKQVDINQWFRIENLLANIPYFLFLMLLAIIYIGNSHTVEKKVREIDRLKTEMKEIRWEYMSTKAELMYKSKQTEVAKAVEDLGLEELVDPPKKIIIEE